MKYKFCHWGRIQKLGHLKETGIRKRLQGNASTYKQPQQDEDKEQKLFQRLVGSEEDDAAHEAGKEVKY